VAKHDRSKAHGGGVSSAGTSREAALRSLPSVNDLAGAMRDRGGADGAPWSLVVEACRRTLEQQREALLNGGGGGATLDSLVEAAAHDLEQAMRPPLAPVINATGIALHTGLGRAPLAESAATALYEVARGYAAVELELDSGKRGKRSDIVRALLCELTGAESATVVNNNAAALMIALSTVAKGRDVIVSRGELIEIGGSFRLPEVIETGGARLAEVGTTNKTKPADYERAVTEASGALMKAHPSNYRVEGFHQEVSIETLVEIGRRFDLPVIHDIGSGLLRPAASPEILADEPDAQASVRAGADLVLFSGDKLLGGPQAGIIVGKRRWIERIEKNALMRALRVDKLTLAALGVTLQLHRDAETATEQIPALVMMGRPAEALRGRALALAQQIGAIEGIESAAVRESTAMMGGGSAPVREAPSVAVAIRARGVSEADLARGLRLGSPPVMARVSEGLVWLDLRAAPEEADGLLVEAVGAAVGKIALGGDVG